MFRIFYSEKDTILYEAVPDANTGVAELLEIGKRLGNSGDTMMKSRALLKFDMTEVTTVISKYAVPITDCKFVLQLFTSHAKNLASPFTIDCKLTAQDWGNGTGDSTNFTTDGASWATPYVSWSLDSEAGALWISSSQNIQINNSSIYVSGSGTGGSWYTQVGSGGFNIDQFNQSFFQQGGLSSSEVTKTSPTDINIDVTDAVKLWISGSAGHSIPNNGFLLKFSEADEANEAVTGYLNYFSRDTHTIYVPRLTMYWDNSTFTTGSLASADIESFIVYTRIKPTYKDTEVAKIRIFARDKYPQKSPTNLFPQQTVKYLPATTYYSVLDAATDEVIISYDDIYTKISCDSTSNYIHLDFNGFMPERYYRLELKIVNGFEEQYITDQIYFKVTR